MRQILGANPAMRRAWLEHNAGHALNAVAETAFTPEETRGSIENLVGATQIPLGIGGPIRVNGQHADGLFFVPFATTEGTLVTTYQYGMRAITEAGGANAARVILRHDLAVPAHEEGAQLRKVGGGRGQGRPGACLDRACGDGTVGGSGAAARDPGGSRKKLPDACAG